MKTILLKFAGPLQAWGTNSHFEKRHTDRYPSKSAVLGMIAAGFGYRRDDNEHINKLNDLHFAIRIDQPGHILRDYHTAHKYKPKAELAEWTDSRNLDRTYVTERYYLEDAVFVVAIGSENEKWIDEIETAIRNPYFPLYLGRRSLPVTEDLFLTATDEDVIAALKTYPWQASSWYQKRHTADLEIYADVDLLPGRNISYRRDHVTSFSNYGRKYELRGEGRIWVHLPTDNENLHPEHDAFGALGE